RDKRQSGCPHAASDESVAGSPKPTIRQMPTDAGDILLLAVEAGPKDTRGDLFHKKRCDLANLWWEPRVFGKRLPCRDSCSIRGPTLPGRRHRAGKRDNARED